MLSIMALYAYVYVGVVLANTNNCNQGTGDVVFSAANAQEEIKLFTNSKEAKLVTLKDGVHFLSFTHPKEVHQNILEFTNKWQAKL